MGIRAGLEHPCELQKLEEGPQRRAICAKCARQSHGARGVIHQITRLRPFRMAVSQAMSLIAPIAVTKIILEAAVGGRGLE